MSLPKIRVPLVLAVAGVLGWAAAQSTSNFCPVPGTVTDIGGVVNTYYPGVGTAGPSVGPVTIQVGPRRTGGGPDIAPGDLLLIVQMQDATFNFDPSDTSSAAAGNAAFGTLRDLNSAGRYEYATATAVGVGSVTVGSLRYRYTSADSTATAGQKRFQVVRVARYGNARIISEIRALEWEGRSGGIVALDVTGTLDFNGQRINVNGQGFRGGGGERTTGDGVENTAFGVPTAGFAAGLGIRPTSFFNPAVSEGPLDEYFPYWRGGAPHGTKGEGIGGAPLGTSDLPRVTAPSDQTDQYDRSRPGLISGYPRLTYPGAGGEPGGNGIDKARGAILNAGGGGTDGQPYKDRNTAPSIVDGNSFNSGGGGGSNAGAGGKGGNSWVRPTPPAMDPGAIAVPTGTPGVFTGSEASGGRGGLALAADPTFGYTPTAPDRVYLGGGGGSGSINDEAAYSASGADGGGIVLVRAATVSGNGSITASGLDALRLEARTNKPVPSGTFDDAAGGGGGGGVIVVQTSTNTTLPLSLSVNGGNGGSTRPIGITIPDTVERRHGPGGGGGGGIVYATVGAASVASISTAGGLAGTTAAADNYGARNGSPGAARGLGPWNPGDPLPQCTASLTLTKTTPQASLPAGTTTAAYTLTLTNAGPGTATSTTISDDLPDGFTLVAGSAAVTYGGGATGPATPAVSGADPVVFGNFDLPPGGVVTLNYRVNLNNAQPNTDYVNTARAAGTGPGGTPLTAGPVSATVRLAGVAPTATPDRATTPFNTPVVFGPGPFPPGVTPAPPVFENDSPQCRAILSGGGRITLLDGNNPVSTLTVANQGTFEVQQPGNLVRFTPVQGFVGPTSAVPYGYLNPPVPPGTLDASCRSTITVTVQPPVLTKSVDKTLVAVGEELTYTLTLRGQVTNATLEFSDLLPLGLIYRPGTSTLSGVALATEPTAENVSGRQRLTWRLTGVTGTDPVIRFRVVVTDRVSNPIVNGAQIIVTPPGGPPPGSPPPPTYGSNTVTTRLITSAFSSSGEIVGRVYFDRNRDDNFTQGIDEPLQGARVYLSNGRFAITDGLGRYSITNVETGTWAIRVDRLTVPYVPKAVPDDQGLRGTRYVRVVGAGVYHEDFLYELPGMLVSRVRATRLSMGGASGVQIEKIVTEVGRGSFVVTLRLSVGAPVRGLEITDPVPTGATRGALNNNASLQPSVAGNLITLPGVLSAGTYTFSYTLTSNNLALDQVITDPDLFWDEVTP
ncbi:MAG: hypothetical protein SFU83_19335 [Meiothermus sp.]|nr:hypothetical protein [Meiothermus sp.]